MVGGWGLMVYLLQYLWQNFVSIIKEHQAVAVGEAGWGSALCGVMGSGCGWDFLGGCS